MHPCQKMSSTTQRFNEVTIRPALQSDFDFLFHLVCITMKDYVAATTVWDELKEKETFAKYFDFSSYQISVVVLDGSDIGYLKIGRTEKELFLANLHIHPDFQNQGIGSQIIKTLLADAKQQGVEVSLKVLTVNQGAFRLYKKLGFSIEEETEDYYLMRARST